MPWMKKGMAAREEREEMIDKEKERNKGKAQVMFFPWLPDFNFSNWMDRTGIFNTKRIEKR